eukprot:scaffold118193_cov35-Tisochrysis_lutea.AAC.2
MMARRRVEGTAVEPTVVRGQLGDIPSQTSTWTSRHVGATSSSQFSGQVRAAQSLAGTLNSTLSCCTKTYGLTY